METQAPASSRSKGDILVPPENFALVERGLYRGAFPKPKNFPFLRTLGLRTILSLKLEKTNEYPAANTAFNHEHGIQLLMFGMPGNKEPFVDIPEDGIAAALAAASAASAAAAAEDAAKLARLASASAWEMTSSPGDGGVVNRPPRSLHLPARNPSSWTYFVVRE